MWKPLSFDELQHLILVCELDIEGTELDSFWRLIKIPPQKWQQEPWGNEGGGFWVVAIWGTQVMWYNDIEEGFNTSPYSEFGVLGDYGANQSILKEHLVGLYQWFNNQINTGPPLII